MSLNSQILHAAASQLVETASEVIVKVRWFQSDAKVQADELLEGLGTTDQGASVAKHILRSKHPAVKVCNDRRRDIESTIGVYTIPKYIYGSRADGRSVVGKAPGIRLIAKTFMKDFDEALQTRTEALYRAVAELETAMPEVIVQEKARLGKLFDPTDYIDRDIRELVGVERRYRNAHVDIAWEAHCPEILARERDIANRERFLTVRLGARDLARECREALATLRRQLGGRKTILRPDADDPRLGHLRDGELLDQLHHEDDPTAVPAGLKRLRVRLKDGKETTIDVDDEAWQSLKLYRETQRATRIYASAFARLRELDQAAQYAEPLLGQIAAPIRRVIRCLESDGKGIQQDVERLAQDARRSGYARRLLLEALETAAPSLRETMAATLDEDELTPRPTRRIIRPEAA